MMIEVKICDNCNHRNLVNAVECENCGYDLTFVYPQTIDDSEPSKEDLKSEVTSTSEDLSSEQDQWSLVYTADENIQLSISSEISLGRDCDPFNELFNNSNYTSRIHAKVRVLDEKVQVMDASTNGTFVAEKRIPKMEWINVDDGETVRFADVSFIVRKKQSAD